MVSYVYIFNTLNYLLYLFKNNRFLASILHRCICPWEIGYYLVFNSITFAVPFRYQGAFVHYDFSQMEPFESKLLRLCILQGAYEYCI